MDLKFFFNFYCLVGGVPEALKGFNGGLFSSTSGPSDRYQSRCQVFVNALLGFMLPVLHRIQFTKVIGQPHFSFFSQKKFD